MLSTVDTIITIKNAGEGCGGQAPLLPFLRGQGVSEVPFINCFYSILATVIQPENTTDGTLCSKLTEIHPIALPPTPLINTKPVSSNISNAWLGKRIINICWMWSSVPFRSCWPPLPCYCSSVPDHNKVRTTDKTYSRQNYHIQLNQLDSALCNGTDISINSTG